MFEYDNLKLNKYKLTLYSLDEKKERVTLHLTLFVELKMEDGRIIRENIQQRMIYDNQEINLGTHFTVLPISKEKGESFIKEVFDKHITFKKIKKITSGYINILLKKPFELLDIKWNIDDEFTVFYRSEEDPFEKIKVEFQLNEPFRVINLEHPNTSFHDLKYLKRFKEILHSHPKYRLIKLFQEKK